MTLTGRITDDGKVKLYTPWVAMLLTAALAIGGAAMTQWVMGRVADQRHDSKNEQQDEQIKTLFATFKSAIDEMSAAIKDSIRVEAQHTREITSIQFNSFGARLDKHEEMIEELQRERRPVYQVAPK